MNLAFSDLDHDLLHGDNGRYWFRTAENMAESADCLAKPARFHVAHSAVRVAILDFDGFALIPPKRLHRRRPRFAATCAHPSTAQVTCGLITRHRNAGHRFAMIPATRGFITEFITTQLRTPHLPATTSEHDGTRVVGRVSGASCVPEDKSIHLRNGLYERQFTRKEARSYSESHNSRRHLKSSGRSCLCVANGRTSADGDA